MKNDLKWNKQFALEPIIIEVKSLSDEITYKSALIAPMTATSFIGYPLRPIDRNDDTVWVVYHAKDYEATHIDISQIIWWGNPQLNMLYGKT